MRVAFLVPAPLDTVSGGYAYDRRMIAGLRHAGHRVDVVELAGPVAARGARAVAARGARADAARGARADAARAAWAGVADDAVPVIDGLGLPDFDGLGDAIAARRTIGLIHHPTALETGRGEAERDRLRVIEQRLMSRLARVIVTSDSTAERLAGEFGVDRARIVVVVPGTEDAPRSTGSGGPGCVLLSVGALVPRKGHDLLMRALAWLFDLDWHLIIAGGVADGAYAHSLRALAEALRIASRVTFAGVVAETALERLWQRADIFALASWHEGYGMAVAEALKRGLPVAVSDDGALGALVSPQAGVICAPGDVVTLSKSLRRLIFDEALRRDMAEAAWQLGQSLPGWTGQEQKFIAALT
jgi:glycosyltransferase involved in cell wall biosynthesis